MSIVGVLVGAIITFKLAIQLERLRNKKAACRKIKEAFAPTLAFIYIAEKNGPHNRPDISAHLKDAIFIHGTAVEQFRPFVPKGRMTEYQKAWEEYHKAATMNEIRILAESEISGVTEYAFLTNKIQNILLFAK